MARSHKGMAFTLVELLVVVAIIAILAGLLMPILGSARATARDTICTGNLRGINTALLVYMSKYDNYLPPCGPDEGNTQAYEVWYRALGPIVENWEVYECPSKATAIQEVPERLDEAGQPDPDTKFWSVNYGMNFQFPGLDDEEDLLGDTIPVYAVNVPSRVLFIADGAIFPTQIDLAALKNFDEVSELPDSIVDGTLHFPEEEGSMLPADEPTISPRHRGRTVCLFLDGSVKRIETRVILSAGRGDHECLYDGEVSE
jgi:prepilin-type N-terminal cleavage/methylation domain-containing protein/prepilin-type processing-associated H-X9-DG protein